MIRGVFVSFTQLEQRETQTVTYCTLASQLPHFLSLLEWCHGPAGDVMSLSSAFPFLSSASAPLWPGTISRARTNKQYSEHVKHCKNKPAITDKALNSFHVYFGNLSLVKNHIVIVKPDRHPNCLENTSQRKKEKADLNQTWLIWFHSLMKTGAAQRSQGGKA